MCIVYLTLLLLSIGWTESATVRTLSIEVGGQHGTSWAIGKPLKGVSEFLSDLTEPVSRVFHSFTHTDNNETTSEAAHNETKKSTVLPSTTKPTIDYSNRKPVVEEKIKKVKAFTLCVVNEQYNCGKELGDIDIMKHLGPPPPNEIHDGKTDEGQEPSTEIQDVTTAGTTPTTLEETTYQGEPSVKTTTNEAPTSLQNAQLPTTISSTDETITTEVPTTTDETTPKITAGASVVANSALFESGSKRKPGGFGLYPADYLNYKEEESPENDSTLSTQAQSWINYKDIAHDNSQNVTPESDDVSVTSESTKTTRAIKEEDMEENPTDDDQTSTKEDVEKSVLDEKPDSTNNGGDKETTTQDNPADLNHDDILNKEVTDETAEGTKTVSDDSETSDKEYEGKAKTEEEPTASDNNEDAEKTNTEESPSTTDSDDTSDKEHADKATVEDKPATSDSDDASNKEDEEEKESSEEKSSNSDSVDTSNKEDTDEASKDKSSDSDSDDTSNNEDTDEDSKEDKSSDSDSDDASNKSDADEAIKEDKSSSEEGGTSSDSDNTENKTSVNENKTIDENKESEKEDKMILDDEFADFKIDDIVIDDIMETSSSDKIINVTERAIHEKIPVKEIENLSKNTTPHLDDIPDESIEATSTEISVVTQVSIKMNRNITKEEEKSTYTQTKKLFQSLIKDAKEYITH